LQKILGNKYDPAFRRCASISKYFPVILPHKSKSCSYRHWLAYYSAWAERIHMMNRISVEEENSLALII